MPPAFHHSQMKGKRVTPAFQLHKNSDTVQSSSAHQTQNAVSPQGGNTGIARNPKEKLCLKL